MKDLVFTNRQNRIALIALFSAAGILFCLISFVNHYLFKTYALDLGLYTHVMYDYMHFSFDDCSMFKPLPQNILSDHFDLYLMIFSPLVLIFGSYTLLIVQIAAVLLGGWGIYKLITLYTHNNLMPLPATATFFFSFGIIQALAFDYHSNVVTAMMLPWLLYFIKKKNFGLSSLFVVLFVIGKENMSLWLFFVAIGLMWDYRKDKKTLWYLLGYAIFAITYFILINMLVMPSLGGAGGGFDRYTYLGDNYMEIAKNAFTHPVEMLRILFNNTTGNPDYDGIKAEFYYCILTTGMIFTLFKPNYLFMVIPLIAQKMLATERFFWGISFQYSIEFMPVFIIASFLVFFKLKKQVLRLGLATALFISTLLTTFYTIGLPKSFIFIDQLCVYQKRHYQQSHFDAHYARQLIKQIPQDASVCASSMFVPHLAMRPEIYDFEWNLKTDACYYLVTKQNLYSDREEAKQLSNQDEFEIVASDSTVYLLHRIKE